MRRFLLTMATAASVLAVTSCSDATGIGGIAGTYELRTLNGQSLPVSDQFGSRTIEAGQLELDSDGNFLEIIQYRLSGSSLIRTDEFFGTWDRDGSNRIRLDYDSGDVLFADRPSSNRIELEDNDGNFWVYQRF